MRDLLPPCLALITLGLACADPKPDLTAPRFLAAGPADRIGPLDTPRAQTLIFDPRQGLLRLQGAVHEVIAFQWVVCAEKSAFQVIEVSGDDLVSRACTIPGSAFKFYRTVFISVSRFPNWYLRTQGRRGLTAFPDALLPVESADPGQAWTVLPGQAAALWIEIHLPVETKPGLYRSTLRMRLADGRALAAPLELAVKDIFLNAAVTSARLPQERLPVVARVQLEPILRAAGATDPQNLARGLSNPAIVARVHDCFALLQSHGLDPYTDEVYPRFGQDADGHVRLDWQAYDDFVGPLIDGNAHPDGRPPWRWPLPIGEQQPNPAQFDGPFSRSFEMVFQEYAAECVKHFKEKGWLDRAFVDLRPRAGAPSAKETVERFSRLASLVRRADARLPIACDFAPQPMDAFGWLNHPFADLSGLVDIWTTPARYQHPPTLRNLQIAGKHTWLPPDRPPFGGCLHVAAPTASPRGMAWQAFLHGHEALWLPQTTAWPDALIAGRAETVDELCDGFVIYPPSAFGRDRPAPSMRLKQLMLGLQDYQYLRLLEHWDRRETARLLAGTLIKAAGTDAYGDNYQDGLLERCIHDPQAWDLAHSILVQEASAAVAQSPDEASAGGAKKSDWASFLSMGRRLELRPESARMELKEEPSSPAKDRGASPAGRDMLVTFEAVVRNELRTAVSGRLGFRRGIASDESEGAFIEVGPLAEMAMQRCRLVQSLPALPTLDLAGHALQPIIFDAGPSGLVESHATLSVVQAARVSRPITIDGRLDDWPPGEGNVAADFQIVGAGGALLDQGVAAESQTVAYFCCDQRQLYIGLQAASPPAEGALLRASNVVEYEDLRPVGADLIEILLDPTHLGTQSGDFYHVVLKSTGDPLFEKGVCMEPPIGRCEPWPLPLPKYAVARREDGWSAEIAIALECFGKAARKRVWGLNVARLEPQRGEYSDWARAPRYCYDPRATGNLIWPRP